MGPLLFFFVAVAPALAYMALFTIVSMILLHPIASINLEDSWCGDLLMTLLSFAFPLLMIWSMAYVMPPIYQAYRPVLDWVAIR